MTKGAVMQFIVILAALSYVLTSYAGFPDDHNCPKLDITSIDVPASDPRLGRWEDGRLESLKNKFETLKRSDPAVVTQFTNAWSKKCGNTKIGTPCFLYESEMYPNGRADHVLLFRGSIASWTSLTSTIVRFAINGNAPCEGTCNLDSVAMKASALVSEIAPYNNIVSREKGFVYDVTGRRWTSNVWSYRDDICWSERRGTYVLSSSLPQERVTPAFNPLFQLGVNHANGVSPFWHIGMLHKNEVVGFDPFVSFTEDPNIAVAFSPYQVPRSFLVLSVPESEVPATFGHDSSEVILKTGKVFRPAGMNSGEREVDMTLAVDESALHDVLLLEVRK